MVKLATKYTHKNSWSNNRKSIAVKLDTIVRKVSKRGIFVVGKNHDTGNYEVINYANKNPVISSLPTRKIADAFCTKYNKGQHINKDSRKLGEILYRIDKLRNDCMFYNYTMTVSKDPVRVEVATNRKDLAVLQLNDLHEKLLAFL